MRGWTRMALLIFPWGRKSKPLLLYDEARRSYLAGGNGGAMPSDLPLRRPAELSFGFENEAPAIGPSHSEMWSQPRPSKITPYGGRTRRLLLQLPMLLGT
jgi:hypothetical protein